MAYHITRDDLKQKIQDTIMANDPVAMDQVVMDLYQYQYDTNLVYRDYVNHLGRPQPSSVEDIPYMPISAFKHHQVVSGDWEEQCIYTSSGTTGQQASKHYVRDKDAYLTHAKSLFRSIYGAPEDYVFLALLPSYLERTGSSLIDMMDYFISCSSYEQSAFYLHDHNALYEALLECQSQQRPTILFGVSFALIDFFQSYQLNFPELIVMETGGMKGRRAELPKAALHDIIIQSSGVETVHSEYGMTELSSQLYSKGQGIFDTHAYLVPHIREISDPLTRLENHKQGIVCLRDMANIDSCSFIMTEDTGFINTSNQLILTGRLDMAEARGCNLLLTEIA